MEEFTHLLILGRFDQAEERLRRDPSLIWRRYHSGVSHLHRCAQFPSYAGALFLLSAGAPADVYDKEGVSPLHWACRSADLKLCELLLEHGARADDRSLWEGMVGRRPNLDLLKLLLAAGADKSMALHCAIQSCWHWKVPSPLVCYLLRTGVDPNVTVDGHSPLHALRDSSNIGLIQVLLDHGARPDLPNDRGRTALDVLADREWCGCPKPLAGPIRKLMQSAAT